MVLKAKRAGSIFLNPAFDMRIFVADLPNFAENMVSL